MNITIFGAGYVGYSSACLFAEDNLVNIIEIDDDKIEKINNHEILTNIITPDETSLINEKKLCSIKAFSYTESTWPENQDFYIIAVPTNFNDETQNFDLSTINDIISKLNSLDLRNCKVIIKSTVPTGYTENLANIYSKMDIIFSPEFLRERYSIQDSINPSRIIAGYSKPSCIEFTQFFIDFMGRYVKNSPQKFIMTSSEAESVKLFSNSYLAMRIAFFNELETFSNFFNLNTRNLIEGVCSDNRIGNYYNNPSFGYGGYCLPKDVKQLCSLYQQKTNSFPLINAIDKSNQERMNYIAKEILSFNKKTIGIYKLNINEKIKNTKNSPIIEIINLLKKENVEILIYDPEIKNANIPGTSYITDLITFKEKAEIILANRKSAELNDVLGKVYSKDIFWEQ